MKYITQQKPMSYLENIQTTKDSAGFSLKTLDIPRLQNLFLPVGLVGNLAKQCVIEKRGGAIKVPVPRSNDFETVLGGTITDAMINHFQSQSTGGDGK